MSLERQLRAVSTALPTHARICCHFVDVRVWNSSRDGLMREGLMTVGWRLDGHCVLGGLRQLVRRARNVDRDFDVVVCVNDFRLPRRVAARLAVEEGLAECGVGIAALTNTGTAHLLEPLCMLHGRWLRRLGDWGTDSVARRSRVRPQGTVKRRGLSKDGGR